MDAAITTVGILLSMYISFIYGNSKPTVVFSPLELEKDSNLLNKSLKFALRYGFQKTSECNDFPKAYICVQKCLDLGYDIAHSDRYCFCTCYYNKGKHTTHSASNRTKWKLGAPTTKLPAWASTDLSNNTEIEYILVDGNATVVTERTHDDSTGNFTADTLSTDNSTGITLNPEESNTTATEADGSKTGETGETHDGTKDPAISDATDHAGTGTNTGDVNTGGTQEPVTNQNDGTSEKPADGTSEKPADATTAAAT